MCVCVWACACIEILFCRFVITVQAKARCSWLAVAHPFPAEPVHARRATRCAAWLKRIRPVLSFSGRRATLQHRCARSLSAPLPATFLRAALNYVRNKQHHSGTAPRARPRIRYEAFARPRSVIKLCSRCFGRFSSVHVARS